MSEKPEYLTAVTRLRRYRDTIHTKDCRYAKSAASLPWLWAEDKTDAEIARSTVNGLRFCRVCKPLGPGGADPKETPDV